MIRTLPDGTRVYEGGMRYKPVPQERRKYRVRRPDDHRAFRVGGEWHLPLQLLPDEERLWPESLRLRG